MVVLGIETATSIATVGLASPQHAPVERSHRVEGNHASTLLELIDETLAAAGVRLPDLDRIAVSVGPGSFTGLRIGLSVAKGVGAALTLPVVGVPTLDAYARLLGRRDGMVWPVLDARKGEVYAAGYRWSDTDLIRAVAPMAITPLLLVDLFQQPCTLVGDGVDAHDELWQATPAVVARFRLVQFPPSGLVVAEMGSYGAEGCLADLEPTYCRAAEAERRRGSSIHRITVEN